ncbi:nucleotidyltransferase domain-containing protein [Candidatus Peribacteria bacterium]|nr:nucleotidyltransferase domain-containing protein [Candidatus Peribacteria bacterium]
MEPMEHPTLWHSAQHWAEKLSRYLPIEGVWLSGSLARGEATQAADADLFILCQPGSLYTVRLGVVLWLRMAGALATTADHAGRLCPNHFLASPYTLGEESAYMAMLLHHMQVLTGPESLLQYVQYHHRGLLRQYGYPAPVGGKRPPTRPAAWWWRALEPLSRLLTHAKITRLGTRPLPAGIFLGTAELRLHPGQKHLQWPEKR